MSPGLVQGGYRASKPCQLRGLHLFGLTWRSSGRRGAALGPTLYWIVDHSESSMPADCAECSWRRRGLCCANDCTAACDVPGSTAVHGCSSAVHPTVMPMDNVCQCAETMLMLTTCGRADNAEIAATYTPIDYARLCTELTEIGSESRVARPSAYTGTVNDGSWRAGGVAAPLSFRADKANRWNRQDVRASPTLPLCSLRVEIDLAAGVS